MSTSVIELEMLDGIDAEGSPPCQMKVMLKGYSPCGRPAVARILIRCRCDRKAEPVFLCDNCLSVVQRHGAACASCGAKDFSWSAS